MPQFIPGGPNVPLEVIHAWENDKLVLFCGAGISMDTGLPSFKGLVEKLLPLLSGNTNCQIAMDAFKNNQYDKALHLIENNITKNFMRKELIKFLMPEPVKSFNHKVILELARLHSYPKKIRLVTTNVDHRFQETGLLHEVQIRSDPKCQVEIHSVEIHAAPRLAPPRPEEWQSLVFLHGVIDRNNDPNGKQLVFTSADFGRAYLRDAWAARFVVELFREFTVLFIGYSVNDPVMGYLVDALAADLQRYNRAYAFGGYSDEEDLNNKKNTWHSKSIEMIPYQISKENGQENHSILYSTLEKWRKSYEPGLSDISKKIKELLSNKKIYDIKYKEDGDIIRWLLSMNNGRAMQLFAKTSPVIDISWLQPLSESFNIINKINNRKTSVSLTRFPINGIWGFEHRGAIVSFLTDPALSLPLSPVSYWMAVWLSKHLDKIELIRWIQNQGGVVHPVFAGLIYEALEKKAINLDKNLTYFWNNILIQTIKYLGVDPGFQAHFNLTITRKDTLSEPEKAFLMYVWTPKANITLLSDRTHTEIILTNDYVARELSEQHTDKNTTWPPLADLTDELTSHLAQAVRMGINAELHYFIGDNSLELLPSISPHEQNRPYKSWILLVELCRLGFEALRQKNMDAAKHLVENWEILSQREHHGIFRRLALYAYACCDQLPIEDAIDLLLEDNTLWNSEFRREVCRLLVRQKDNLSKSNKFPNLKSIIEDGPPRFSYLKNLSDDDFNHRQRMIDLLSRKLQDQDDQRDEFLMWTEITVGHVSANADHWIHETPERIAQQLQNTTFEADDLLAELVAKDLGKGLATMVELDKLGDHRPGLWQNALVKLSTVLEQKTISDTLEQLNRIAQPILSRSFSGLCNVLHKAAEVLPDPQTEPEAFWALWDRGWEDACADQTSLSEEYNAYDWAINQPGGKLAEALWIRFYKRLEYVNRSVLPEDLKARLNKLVQGETNAHQAARLIFVPYLSQLYFLDAEWTKEHLLSKVYWDPNLNPHVDAFWDAFKFSQSLFENSAIGQNCLAMAGKIQQKSVTVQGVAGTVDSIQASFQTGSQSIDLALINVLKNPMIQFLEQIQTEEEIGRFGWLLEIFMSISLDFPASFQENEVRSVLCNLSPRALAPCSNALLEGLRRTTDRDDFWDNVLQPFVTQNWPIDNEHRTPEIQEDFTLMLLETYHSFPQGLSFLEEYGFLDEIKSYDRVLVTIDDSQKIHLINSFPAEVLHLLDKVIPPDTAYLRFGTNGFLRKILDTIKNNKPELEEDHRYFRLDNLC